MDTLRVYEAGRTEMPPRLRNGAAVQAAMVRLMPAPLRDAGWRGEVTVTFVVERDGRTSGVEVVRPSDTPEMDRATVELVGTMRFEPAQLNGHAVRARMVTPVSWQAAR
jgi:TonB family protein